MRLPILTPIALPRIVLPPLGMLPRLMSRSG